MALALVSVVVSLTATPLPRPRIDVLGVSSHVAAAVGAMFEIAEDLEGIGHGHGVGLLVVSKLAREGNLIRESAVETVESAEAASIVKRFAGMLWKLLTAKLFAATLCALALFAAGLEVLEDLSPGGHHGAVLLALNELIELLVSSGLLIGKIGSVVKMVLDNTLLKLAIVGGATAVALVEVFSSGQLRLGGHHSVAILAVLKTLRCVGMLRDAAQGEKEE
uniref:Uncharacterized protein n=1 Tax=Prymnesium polylepis TaxID=72548 RepID=A0A7S4HCM3_9EUKA